MDLPEFGIRPLTPSYGDKLNPPRLQQIRLSKQFHDGQAATENPETQCLPVEHLGDKTVASDANEQRLGKVRLKIRAHPRQLPGNREVTQCRANTRHCCHKSSN